MMNVHHSRNCVYQTAYHVVWCPKYRKSVLSGLIAKYLEGLLREICEQRGCPIISLEIQPDHIHLFLTIPPALSVADMMRVLKGTTARKLLLTFPELKQKLWDGNLWSPSYYVGTAGNVSAETIQKYIERTAHIKGRR